MPANVEALYMIGAGLTGIGSGGADSLLSTGGPNTWSGLAAMISTTSTTAATP